MRYLGIRGVRSIGKSLHADMHMQVDAMLEEETRQECSKYGSIQNCCIHVIQVSFSLPLSLSLSLSLSLCSDRIMDLVRCLSYVIKAVMSLCICSVQV